MGTLFQDFRYALRMFQRKPGFTVIAVVTLALGIGANTAVFSVVNAFLLQPLPYKDPDRLVIIQHTAAAGDYESVDAYPVFNDLREQVESFDGVAAFAWRRLTLDGSDGPETVFGSTVTSNFLAVLGVVPMIGRGFLAGEDEPNKPRLAMLSYGLWQRRFGADPNIIGRAIVADKESVEIVGVMPPNFKSDLLPEIPKVEFWMTLNPGPRMVTSRNINWLRIIARLKPTITVAQTRSELDVIAERQNARQPPNIVAGHANDLTLTAVSLKDFFVGDARKQLLVLLGAVGFVLLIACVNVANLLLAQGVGRRKEVAIRAVLGATRRRIMSQMLTESLTLSVAGGALGMLFVMWSLEAIKWLTPKWMTRMEEISLDRRVFLFTLTASLLTGILFGLLPSFQASKVDLQSTLKLGSGGRASGHFRGLLVIGEVALAVVLLVGAGLMIKSFVRLTNVDIGFDSKNVLSLQLDMLSRSKKAEQTDFVREVLGRTSALPGVTQAAVIDFLPTEGGASQSNKRSSLLEGPILVDPDAQMTIVPRAATPAYFETMGIKLLRGRLFDDSDTADAQPVVVISEQMAQQSWPGEDPIGKRFLWSWAKDQRPTVIGVVNDVRESNLSQEPPPYVYIPFSQNPDSFISLVVRSADSSKLATAIRGQILAIDRGVAIEKVMTLEQRLGDLVAQPRFYTFLFGWFAGMGMLLAVLGLYGVLSYTVSQRTHEVGIRVALGARSQDILKLIVGHGLVLISTGLALGLAGAVALSRLMSSLLFGVTATDPATYVAVSSLLLAIAMLACYLPARRAAKVDPLAALKCE
jgi:putative ABC transport system permease protein